MKKGIFPMKTISDIPQHDAYFICDIYQLSYIRLSGQQAGFFWQQWPRQVNYVRTSRYLSQVSFPF